MSRSHLGRATGGAARLGGARAAIKNFEEAHDAARKAAAREFFHLAADLREVRARARAVLEDAGFVFHEIKDRHQIIVQIDETSEHCGVRALVVSFIESVAGSQKFPPLP